LRVLIFLIALIFPLPACADFASHVTFQKHPPGSVRIKYGGVRSPIYNGAHKYLKDLWEDNYLERYEYGQIDYFELNKNLQTINDEMQDNKNGGKWWERKWRCSLNAKLGGAPKYPIVTHIGQTTIILNTPIFSLSNSFKFEFKEFKATIDCKADDPFGFGANYNFSGYGWEFKISPKIKFGLSKTIRNLGNFIRKASFWLTTTYFIKHIPVIKFRLGAIYNLRKNEMQLVFLIELT